MRIVCLSFGVEGAGIDVVVDDLNGCRKRIRRIVDLKHGVQDRIGQIVVRIRRHLGSGGGTAAFPDNFLPGLICNGRIRI